ncbi:hypothetical protein [Bacillus paramobilis]|uniref:hypothetical protein n=1 Tax=Bacillus paramobilis TaxID=2817477 RepID=UPI003D23723C
MDAFRKYDYLSQRRLHLHLAIPTVSVPEGKAIGFDLSKLHWNEVKFLEDDGSGLHSDMNTIPKDTGGIYMFQVKSEILPNQVKYPLYIGRARYSNSDYNLQYRCKSYKRDKRPSIKNMIRLWGPNLYISYTTIGDNTTIDDIESWLIGTILPACNSVITNVSIKEAVSMF